MVHLGTSGYSYRHWRRLFYPEGLPAGRWLDHYARVFSTVELNATFYRLPTPLAVDGWRENTPPGFRFAAKGSRYLTHLKTAQGRGAGRARPPRLTGGFRYLRFHGATGKYRGRYGRRALRPVAQDLARFAGDAYVYFNNDLFGHAISDAIELSSLLDSAHAVRHQSRGAAAALE